MRLSWPRVYTSREPLDVFLICSCRAGGKVNHNIHPHCYTTGIIEAFSPCNYVFRFTLSAILNAKGWWQWKLILIRASCYNQCGHLRQYKATLQPYSPYSLDVTYRWCYIIMATYCAKFTLPSRGQIEQRRKCCFKCYDIILSLCLIHIINANPQIQN